MEVVKCENGGYMIFCNNLEMQQLLVSMSHASSSDNSRVLEIDTNDYQDIKKLIPDLLATPEHAREWYKLFFAAVQGMR